MCLAATSILAVAALTLSAQNSPTLTVVPQPTVKVKKAAATTVTVKASLPAGFHCNSNTPSEAYLIPLKLTWAAGPIAGGVHRLSEGEVGKIFIFR